MTIAATLGLLEGDVLAGGGLLYLVEFDAAKEPYLPHASLDTAAAAAAVTLSCYRAPVADTNVPTSFGTTGTLDIDIFAKSAAAEQKAYSALAANDFTIAVLTTARAVGCIVKKNSASDYTLTDWKCLSLLQGTTPRDKTPSTPVYDERDVKVGSVSGQRDVGILTVVMQSSKDVIDFLTKEARTKYFAGKYVVELAAKGYQIWVARKMKLITDLEVPFKGGETRLINVNFEIITVGSNEPYVIYEG